MFLLVFMSYLMFACATFDIEMDTKLTDIYTLNSAVTLTLKSQGQMIIVYVLRMHGPICTKQKPCE